MLRKSKILFSNYREHPKQIGLGTASLLLILLAFFWSADLKSGICIGDNISNIIGLSAWSNGRTGIHYTLFYSLIFLIPAFLLARKYSNHLFAKICKSISLCLIIFLILATFYIGF